MLNEHQIIAQVEAARGDTRKADDLIRAYIPFIRSEASKFLSRLCTEQDDEFSIAMIAFHEAINSYTRERGAFLSYVSLLIRSRLIDYRRKEARHSNYLYLDESREEEDAPLFQLADGRDHYSEAAQEQATKMEIEELAAVLAGFGLTFTDVAENSPKQERTLEACGRAVRCAVENRHLLAELLQTKKLPLAQLAIGSGVERKTLERHRKYIVAMLLIQTNGYEIIRGHVCRVLSLKGGGPA